jgi:hypothetical protein
MNEQVGKVQQKRITSLADLYPISHVSGSISYNQEYSIDGMTHLGQHH